MVISSSSYLLLLLYLKCFLKKVLCTLGAQDHDIERLLIKIKAKRIDQRRVSIRFSS